MSYNKSSQAIKTFYLNDDPTVILDSVEDAASFNAELKEQVRKKLALMARSDKDATIDLNASEQEWESRTAENPFSYDYVFDRLENSIQQAEAKGDSVEALRLGLLLKKLQNQELAPIQVVRQAWLKT